MKKQLFRRKAGRGIWYPGTWPGWICGLIFFGLAVGQALAQTTGGETVSIGRKLSLHSDILGEGRAYWVSLPTSYDDPTFAPQRYPVLYLLDGTSMFYPLCGVVNFMSGRESVNFQVPEMIIVGIDNADRVKDLTPNASNRMPDGTEAKTNLMMAGSGGGEKFFQFLERELIPAVEAAYRTLPYRAYIGHSLGGLTATYTLLHHAGLFDGYLAIDPSLWWDGASMVDKAAATLTAYPTKKVRRYFVSVVDNSGPAGVRGMDFHVNSIHKFTDTLAARAPANLKWRLQVFPETDHSSIPLLSWYYGLRFLFEGYEPDLMAMMANPGLIEGHFKALEATLGLRMPPPECVFEILSHYLTAPNRFPDAQKALVVVTMGLKYYPDSPNLNEKLGLAHEMAKEPSRAIRAYERALELNPKNDDLRKRLEVLKKK